MKKITLITTLLILTGINVNAQNYIWAENMSGSSSGGKSIKINHQGKVCITGNLAGTVDFDPGAGTANLTGASMFIGKYDSNGSYIFAENIVGPTAIAIDVDEFDNIFVMGTFIGTVDFDPSAAVHNLTGNAIFQDVFIAKYDTNGNFLWVKKISRNGSMTYAASISVDYNNNVLLTGYYSGNIYFDTNTIPYTLAGTSALGIYFAKYDPAGSFVFAKGMAGQIGAIGSSISSDSLNNIYLLGAFGDTLDFDPGTGIANLGANGSSDYFISKYDANGLFIWAKSLRGANSSAGAAADFSCIDIQRNGNIYIIGSFNGTVDFDPGAAAANVTAYSNGRDVFVAKYDTNGNYLWVRRIGSALDDSGISIVVDTVGNVFFTGQFYNTVDFDPSASVANLTAAAGSSTFFAEYNSSGLYVYAKSISPNTYNNANIDLYNNIYLTGSFSGTKDFDPSAAFANLTASSTDCFIAKYGTNSTVGYNEITKEENGINIYPNPFTSETTITFNEEQKNTTIKITDVLGNTIQQSTISNQQSALIDMSSFAKGIYFVRIEDEKRNVVNRKIVLQ